MFVNIRLFFYLYYYYIKVVRFSLDLLLGSANLPICCCKITV